jgi:hypothetical protein
LTTDNTEQEILKLPPEVLEKVIIDHQETEGYQSTWYQSAIRRYGAQFEWVARWDDDEYFYDKQHRKINDILSALPDTVGQVIVPWIVFGHSGRVLSPPSGTTRLAYYTSVKEPLPVREECKSIGRLRKVNALAEWWNAHWVENHEGDIVTADNLPAQRIGQWSAEVVSLDTCLAHYRSGSMEDFVNRIKKWESSKEFNIDEGISVETFVERYSFPGHDTRMLEYNDELSQILACCDN